MTWYVYVLVCQNGRLYTGISTDPERRFQQHLSGKGAKFTKANPPAALLGSDQCLSRSDALKREYALKQLSAPAKRKLVAHWAETAQRQAAELAANSPPPLQMPDE